MMSRIRLFALCFIFSLCVAPAVIWAGECSEESKQEIRKQAQEAAKPTCKQMKADAAAYNTLAENYLKNCDPDLAVGTPLMPTDQVRVASEEAGESITDPALYQYRGISWQAPMSFPGCKNCSTEKLSECRIIAQDAYNALTKFNSSIQNAEQQLYASINYDMSNCTCNEEGKEPSCTVVTQTDEDKDASATCDIKSTLNTLSACPLCPIFEVVMNTNAEIAHVAWEGTAAPLSKIVGIFFLVLLAFEALKAVASVGGTKPSAFIKGILILGLKIAITVSLLSNSVYIYKLFISPVMQGGLEMGLAIAQASGASNCSAGDVAAPIASQEIGPELFNSVLGTVRCFSTDAATLPAIGMGLICLSSSFSLWLSGLIITFFGFMIWLAFSFYLIDATVQLGMFSALVPLFIACWPFEMTKQYTAKGVKMLMNSFFTFAFAGVLLLMGTSYITAAMTGGGDTTTKEIMDAINNDRKEGLEYFASLEGMAILTLISCCIFAMKMIANVSGLANKFSVGSGMSFGAELGGITASAGTAVGKAALMTPIKVADFGISVARSFGDPGNQSDGTISGSLKPESLPGSGGGGAAGGGATSSAGSAASNATSAAGSAASNATSAAGSAASSAGNAIAGAGASATGVIKAAQMATDAAENASNQHPGQQALQGLNEAADGLDDAQLSAIGDSSIITSSVDDTDMEAKDDEGDEGDKGGRSGKDGKKNNTENKPKSPQSGNKANNSANGGGKPDNTPTGGNSGGATPGNASVAVKGGVKP